MSFELQQTIRNNAQQLKQYFNDLHDWEQQMQIKQKARKRQKQTSRQLAAEEQEFRKKKIEQESKQFKQKQVQFRQKKKQMIRDVNTVQDYYKAWDKYNPDEEIKKLQQEEKRPYRPYNPYEDSKNNLRAQPKAKMVVKGTRNMVKDPTSLKDKGNVHFKVCQYDRAIQYYTQCINKILNEEELTQNNKKLLALVYSNRAMAYIKTNQRVKALSDCNQSIKYDEQYAKTYLRRADCHRKLGKYKQSLADYRKVKELSPNQAEPDIEIKKIEQFLRRRIKQTQESMVVTAIPNIIPGGYRLQIEEVDDFQPETSQQVQKQQPVNYLQQL